MIMIFEKWFDYWVYVWVSLYFRPYGIIAEITDSNICKNK